MTIKVLSRKTKKPSLPYIFVRRNNIDDILNIFLEQNQKCLYLSAISGFGKTVSITSFLEEKISLWYSLDELDKEPIVFLNYLYHLLTKNNLISDEFEDVLSQPLNNENQIKNFISLICDELENNLHKQVFLVLDNFHEIQNEILIQKIIDSLIKYCPEKLKLVIISQQNIPDILHYHLLKQDINEINLKPFLLLKDEGESLLKIMNKGNDLFEEIFELSQKCISLFILLTQNFYDKESLKKYSENNILKNILTQTTSQIYDSFDDDLKKFINITVFLPKVDYINLNILFGSNFKKYIDKLVNIDVLTFNKNESEYNYNSSFLPIIKENFFNLPINIKESYLDKVINLISIEKSDLLLNILIKAKLYKHLLEYLKINHEYYFKNHLYDTLDILLEALENEPDEDNFIKYIEIKLSRLKGNISKSFEIIKNLNNTKLTPNILLENGICQASLGYFNTAIKSLEEIEKDNLKLNDYLSLINCLGISYMQNHDLDKALDYFNKAIALKTQLPENNDFMKIYHNLGLTYTWMGDFNKAIESYEQSIYLSKQFKLIPLGMTYNNLAIIYNFQGDFNKAYITSLKGLEIVNRINNNFDKIHILLTLAETYRYLKNSYKIEECIEILEDMLIKTPNPILDAIFLRLKSRINTDNKKYIEAKEFLLQAINIRKLSDGDSAFLEYKLEFVAVNFYAGEYLQVIKELDLIESKIEKEKHLYHLSRAYAYKAISYEKTGELTLFKKYKEMALSIIKEKNYYLLEQIFLDDNLEDKIENIEDITQSKKIDPIKTINYQADYLLKINTFGNIDVSQNNVEINKKDWQGKKTKLLLVFLLINKKGVTKDQLFQNLFPEGDKSKSALHVLLNRLRKALESINEKNNIIQFNGDLYSFNFSINYEWDASTFEYLINNAKQNNNIDEKYNTFLKALKLYKNHFLEGFEVENWIFMTQEYYRKLAYKIFEECCDYYFEKKEYNIVFDISEQFFNFDNCYENACKFKMKSLIELNRKQEASKQYYILENALKKSLNDEPSEEMKAFNENRNK